MTTDRCPSCNAAVPAGAEWCTLCYAVLRQPEPVSAVAAEPVAHYPRSMGAIPRSTPAELPPDPILDALVIQAAPVARTPVEGWPCLGCGAHVPLADDACPTCHRPFLPTDDMPTLTVPGVGDFGRMGRGQRWVVSITGALLVMGVLVAIAFIGGSVL